MKTQIRSLPLSQRCGLALTVNHNRPRYITT